MGRFACSIHYRNMLLIFDKQMRLKEKHIQIQMQIQIKTNDDRVPFDSLQIIPVSLLYEIDLLYASAIA